jgi:hypothetical protein
VLSLHCVTCPVTVQNIREQALAVSSGSSQSVMGGSIEVPSCSCHSPSLKLFSWLGSRLGLRSSCTKFSRRFNTDVVTHSLETLHDFLHRLRRIHAHKVFHVIRAFDYILEKLPHLLSVSFLASNEISVAPRQFEADGYLQNTIVNTTSVSWGIDKPTLNFIIAASRSR